MTHIRRVLIVTYSSSAHVTMQCSESSRRQKRGDILETRTEIINSIIIADVYLLWRVKVAWTRVLLEREKCHENVNIWCNKKERKWGVPSLTYSFVLQNTKTIETPIVDSLGFISICFIIRWGSLLLFIIKTVVAGTYVCSYQTNKAG